MFRALIVYLCLLFGIGPALADGVAVPGVPYIGISNAAFSFPPSVSATYTGPGDLKSFSFWGGLRAYNGAYATALGKSVNVCNPGDAACADLSVNSSGNLVVGTVGGLACSYSISSATYTQATGAIVITTSLGANLASGNNFALTGLTGTGANLFRLNIAFVATAGTTGTTVNATGPTLLGALTITGGTVSICTAKTVYDQSGNTNCTSAACNFTQATIANRPMLGINCIGSLPCLVSTAGLSSDLASPSFTTQAQPFSGAYVGARIDVAGGGALLGNSANTIAGWSGGSANLFRIFNGSSLTQTASDAVVHSFQTVSATAASTVVVDGTAATPGTSGSNSLTGVMHWSNSNGTFFTGYEAEAGVASGAWNATDYGNQCHNARLYYGTSGTC